MTNSPQLYPDRDALDEINPDQRIFGTVSAGLALAGLDAGRTAAGEKGEQIVAALLDPLTERDDLGQVYVFHSLRLPGLIADMDHAVLVGRTLFLVDAKLWKRADSYIATVHPGNENPKARKVYAVRDGVRAEAHEVTMHYRIDQWREAFPALRVYGIVAVANEVYAQSENGAGFELMPASQLGTRIGQMAFEDQEYVRSGDRDRLLMMLINDRYDPSMELPAPVLPDARQVLADLAAKANASYRARPFSISGLVALLAWPITSLLALIPLVGLIPTVVFLVLIGFEQKRRHLYRGTGTLRPARVLHTITLIAGLLYGIIIGLGWWANN